MYARETSENEYDPETYEAVDERTVEWLRAQVAERNAERTKKQLHPQLVGR
jgi:hypothetical protein